MRYPLEAGVARVDITPPIGISMVGYYARDGVSVGAERPLTATALVLSTPQTKIAVLACDVVFIQSPDVDEIRAGVAAAIGSEPGCVLINCSHTHCGPTLPGFTFESPEQRAIQGEYLANLKRLLVGCVRMADHDLRRARVGSGAGTAWIGINRRERDSDGKIFLGENPDGPMDPTVGVIRVDELDGRPLAVLFSYGCHTVTMGPRCLQLSPDFAGPARDVIEYATGAKALFLQAAAGNINPITGIGAAEDDSENMNRLGRILGAEAVKVAMQIRTHQKRGPRALWSSLSKNSMYPYVAVEDTGTELAAISETIPLPMMAFPTLEEARRIRAVRKEALEKAQSDGLPAFRLAFYHRFHDWATRLHNRVEAGEREAAMPANFQAIRIGDTGLAAVSGETLAELGLAVREASPFSQTIFLGYSNGCISYIPPAECYPEGGWSPWETYAIPDLLFQSYQLPMALSPQCGQLVVENSLRLLSQVSGASHRASTA
jgi:hypothetical protein